MLTIRRTNVSHRTRNGYTRASQTDEARNEAERNRWNRNQKHINIAFNPYRAAFNYNVEIDAVHSNCYWTNERCVPILQGI